MSYNVYEIVSQTHVKGMPLQVRTVETATTREQACEAHAMEVAVAYPDSRGNRGLVTRIQERPDLRAWAQGIVKEAMDRARQDSRHKPYSPESGTYPNMRLPADWHMRPDRCPHGCTRINGYCMFCKGL